MHADLHPAPADPAASVWPLCLAIARLRRAGATPSAASRYALDDGLTVATAAVDAPLAWSPGAGWSLHGDWPAAARDCFELCRPLLDRPAGASPWVIAQLGQSLDGCIATRSGDAYFVNGPRGIVHVHRLRALCDAVIVGAGTVAADDPQLTTRHVPGEHPVRVVLDPWLRLDAAARVFRDAQAPTLRLHDARCAAPARAQALAAENVAVPGLLGADGGLDCAAVVDALQARGLTLLFVEGGGATVSRFLVQRRLDRLHLSVAPVLIGDGRPGLKLPPTERMADCLRPPARVYRLGDDMLWDLALEPAPRAAAG